MYIKWIKLGDNILRNISANIVDENGNEVWRIPTEFNELKTVIIDTLGWLVRKKIADIFNSPDKREAAQTKAIVLLAKIINTLGPNTDLMTENERNAFEKMLSLADNSYSDSELLNNSLDTLSEVLNWYTTKINELEQCSTVDDLLSFLQGL